MKCQKTEKYLIAYIEGNINQELRQEIESHLADCPNCTRLLARSQQLWDGLELVDTLETPDNFYVGIQQKINNKHHKSVPWFERMLKLERALVPSLATGIVLVGVLIGNFVGNSIYQNVTSSESTTKTTYADYLGLNDWDNSSETELLSGFNQGLEVLETTSVKK